MAYITAAHGLSVRLCCIGPRNCDGREPITQKLIKCFKIVLNGFTNTDLTTLIGGLDEIKK